MGFFSKKTDTKKAAPKPSDVNGQPSTVKAEAKPLPLETGDAHRILVRPLVTEKGSAMASQGKYLFAVSPKANKLSVRKAIHDVYGVTVTGVDIMNVRGKVVRGRHGYGRRSDWRKAVITLKKGDAIESLAKSS